MNADEVFTECRPLLFTVAYEILGSAADAEDVLQDSYLRWSATDVGSVEHPRPYRVQTVTRQALNQLRAASRRREDYVGSWLPEPIRTEPDASEDAILAESVSVAMLLVLETLSPHERAVFVLSEVFGYSHPEIAEAAVVGIPHASLGEEVGAAVALKAGSTLTAEAVRDFVKERVASYKYPRHVTFIETLPKGATGKILKRELRSQ